jgi:hypothetical protein
MPYSTYPYGVKALAVLAGSKTYLLGNQTPSGGKFLVTFVSLASNVATVTVTGWEGVIPVVGTLIAVRGTASASGAFNVTGVPITAVALDATGAGTISYALTGANLGATEDAGTLNFEPIVTGETAAAGNTIAGALARPSGARGQNAVFAQLTMPAAGVTAATVTMQVSSDNVNWSPTTNILTIASGAVTAGSAYFETTALFVRGAISAVTGSGPIALECNI